MKIALTGGIACGKSLASEFLRQLGFELIDADDVVHELMPDAAERRRIAAEVFADPVKRAKLEGRVHPLVANRIDEFFARPGQSALRIAVIPLLFEVHWEAKYDIICAVVSKREIQVERMMTTRGYTRDEAEARLAAQLPVEVKAEKSHYVIENNGTTAELKTGVDRFVSWLKQTIANDSKNL